MSAEFDPYHKWLGIPPKLQPANHYRLLGVELFESDLDVIDAAADQRTAYLQGLASSEHGELSQTLLNEVATARDCLLNSGHKETYDAELRQQIKAAEEEAQQAEAQTQPATAEESGRKDGDQIEPPPVEDDPLPPPVAAAPPLAIPEPDAARPAKSVPPVAPPAVRAGAAEGETAETDVPAEDVLPAEEPPPVRARSTLPVVAPVVGEPTGRPTSHARQFRNRRSNPMLVAVGSAAAVLTLLAVIYVATGQWNNDRPSGSGVSQSTSQTGQRPNDRMTAEQPRVKTRRDGGATGGESAGREERTGDEFLASNPAVDYPAAKPNSPDERPSQDETPFAEARLALTNGQIEQALPLLERVLESPDSERRTWARQMLEEVDVAVSDHTARQSLEQLSDKDLELLAKGEALVDVQNFHFSYPALRERFRQTLKKSAPAALERRRANRAEIMAAASERPSGDAAPRVEDPPAKPKTPEAKNRSSNSSRHSPSAVTKTQLPGFSANGTGTVPATLNLKTGSKPPADPAELLESRGLRKREEFWLLDGDDELRESVERVGGLARSSRAADTAILEAVDKYREVGNRVAIAKQGGRIGIIEEAERRFNNMKREYREVIAKSMKARSQLAVASLQAARRAEEMTAKYQELADDPAVRKALERLGPETNRLGPTPSLERNLKRVQRNDDRLLADQVMGFFGGEEEDVFHVEVILNDRATALFALRPQAEFSLVPEQVLREAGIPYDAEWKVERKADGVTFRTNSVTIPSLRLGRFVSTDIEAFVLPADVRDVTGSLADNAFPDFRIEVQPGENVARLRPVR